MTAFELSPAIDTDPHPAFSVYTAGNFAEVAPERLSIVSWSLVGDPVERACRALAGRLWPSATWHTGSHYAFVGYFACRPYHNLSAYCHMASQMPGLAADDVTASYFEDAQPPPPRRGLAEASLRRLLGLPRMARELAALRSRLTALAGAVAERELRARRALASGSQVALGAEVAHARATLDEAWDVHYATTMSLLPLLALQRRLGRRACAGWDELEPWVNVPDALVWPALHDAAALEPPAPAGEFLGRAFYEVADDRAPWDRYGGGVPPAPAGGEAARRRDPADVVWDIERRGRALGLAQLGRLIASSMAARETSKSLCMRCLHVFRGMLPALAAAAGVDDADWPYLTVAELAEAHLEPELAATAAERRAACEAALRRSPPDALDFSTGAAVAAASAARDGRGRGLAPGTVTGVVVGARDEPRRDGIPRILVCDSVDADIEPLLPHVDGVVTARGSALSHVAILMREHGIPAVAGHRDASRLTPGRLVAVNGSTGEVRILDDD